MNLAAFAENGYDLVPAILSAQECAATAAHIPQTARGAGGSRSLLSEPWCAALAARLRAHPSLSPYIGERTAVQCNYFEKSADRNWLVPIHQDLSIPVAARVADAGLSGWSEKEGVLFVRPPVQVLDELLAVRIHLDTCTLEDGPLRVVAGSHTRGLISDTEAAAYRAAGKETCCVADRGDALVMRPLLLHASSKGSGQGRRRVLHFVFGPRELPCGLAWNLVV
jgi:hypothetical protein